MKKFMYRVMAFLYGWLPGGWIISSNTDILEELQEIKELLKGGLDESRKN